MTKTGTIVGSGKDYNGEKVDFKFKCSALPGLSMNLLSISQLLTEGSVVHLEQGNSYILIKERLSRHVRKVMLEESNGMFSIMLIVKAEKTQLEGRGSLTCSWLWGHCTIEAIQRGMG